jgi:hypothetical protein
VAVLREGRAAHFLEAGVARERDPFGPPLEPSGELAEIEDLSCPFLAHPVP